MSLKHIREKSNEIANSSMDKILVGVMHELSKDDTPIEKREFIPTIKTREERREERKMRRYHKNKF